MSEQPIRSLPAGWSLKGFEEEPSWFGDDVLNAAGTAVLPPGCEDSVWILHNQYVCPPGVDPGPLADEDSGPIYLVAPPSEFVRIRWSEVANIKGVPLRGAFWDGLEVPPCFRWDAMLGWDEAGLVLPGAEFVYQPYVDDMLGLVVGADGIVRRRVFAFELEALLPTLLKPDLPNQTPEFWWPEDRAWVVWTDWDLLGSKVFGSKKLIESSRTATPTSKLWTGSRSERDTRLPWILQKNCKSVAVVCIESVRRTCR